MKCRSNEAAVQCDYFAKKLEMDTREIVSYYVKTFKVYGLWPPENNRMSYNIYNIWSVIVVNLMFIVHSLFKLSSVIFASSVDDIVHILLVASAVVTISMKAFIVRAVKDTFIKLLDLMVDMDKNIQLSEYNTFLHPLVKRSKLVFKSYVLFVCVTWTSLIHQLFVTPPKERIYSSTYYYPYPSLKTPLIYVGGLVYEALANLFIIPIFCAFNLYGIMLMCILVSYIDILCKRLHSFGQGNPRDQKSALFNICELYIDISR